MVLGMMRRIAAAAASGLLVLLAPAYTGWAASACKTEGSAPLAAVNGSGEMLVTWGDSCDHDEGIPLHASAQVAIGSARSGFADLGAVSPANNLSYPTGAFLDDAGDGWILGFNEVVERGGKYDEYKQENTGVWLAFRPADGRFEAPIELPTGGSAVSSALLAGNPAGITLLAWSTPRGSYLAWGSPDGTISSPRFFGRELQVVSAGVEPSGRALIVGYYPGQRLADSARAILTITGRAPDTFSPAHTIAAEHWDPRRRLYKSFGVPVAEIGPSGDAFVAWESNLGTQREEEETPGATELVYRNAGAHFKSPVYLARSFFNYSLGGASATVDGAGRAIIVRETEGGYYQEVVLAPGGHIESVWRLPGIESDLNSSLPSVASNPRGRAVLAWAGPCSSCIKTVLGNTRGARAHLQTFRTPHRVLGGPTAVIDPHGTATAIWAEGTSVTEGYVVEARAIAAGARAVQVAQSPDP